MKKIITKMRKLKMTHLSKLTLGEKIAKAIIRLLKVAAHTDLATSM